MTVIQQSLDEKWRLWKRHLSAHSIYSVDTLVSAVNVLLFSVGRQFPFLFLLLFLWLQRVDVSHFVCMSVFTSGGGLMVFLFYRLTDWGGCVAMPS